MFKEDPQDQKNQSQVEPKPKATPIYSMDAIISLMLKMHPHLLEYFNPDGSFHQFLIRKYGPNSIGFKFAYAMNIYLPNTKNDPTYTCTIRDLYIDALERIPDTNGFSMLQYLRRSNRNLYGFFKQYMYILGGLYTMFLYDEQQNKELRRLEIQIRQEEAQRAQEALVIKSTEVQSERIRLRKYSPPKDFLLYCSEEAQEESSCYLVQAFKSICHKFASLNIRASENNTQNHVRFDDSNDYGTQQKSSLKY